jgi:hypothetical protein
MSPNATQTMLPLMVIIIVACHIGIVQSFAPRPSRTIRDLILPTDVSRSIGSTKSVRLHLSTEDNNSHGSSSSSSSSSSSKKRVVVTGLGVISGCGIGANDFFQACIDGKSSLKKVQRFDIQYYPCQIASEVPDTMFDPLQHFTNPKNVRSNDRYTHFAVAAARQALQDSKYGDTPDTLHNPTRIGVMVGTAFGGMETFEQETLKLHRKPERPKVMNDSLIPVFVRCWM